MQIMRKIISTTCLGLCLLVVPAEAWADSSDQRVSANDLPRNLSFLKRGTASNTMQRLAGIMLQIDPEGNVTPEAMATYESILRAQTPTLPRSACKASGGMRSPSCWAWT